MAREKVYVKYRFGNGVEEFSLEPKTSGSSGIDLCSCEKVILPPHTPTLVKTGLFIELPIGFEGQVRPRSGLALKSGITVLNTPGTIDSDYRNEIGVILYNAGDNNFLINVGDRIAQLVIQGIPEPVFVKSSYLSETERNMGGFGSTGIN